MANTGNTVNVKEETPWPISKDEYELEGIIGLINLCAKKLNTF